MKEIIVQNVSLNGKEILQQRKHRPWWLIALFPVFFCIPVFGWIALYKFWGGVWVNYRLLNEPVYKKRMELNDATARVVKLMQELKDEEDLLDRETKSLRIGEPVKIRVKNIDPIRKGGFLKEPEDKWKGIVNPKLFKGQDVRGQAKARLTTKEKILGVEQANEVTPASRTGYIPKDLDQFKRVIKNDSAELDEVLEYRDPNNNNQNNRKNKGGNNNNQQNNQGGGSNKDSWMNEHENF